MTDMIPLSSATPSAFTTWDGSTVPATISGISDGVSTAHSWTADSQGTYHTDAVALAIEWLVNYQAMQAGHGDTLTALQRMEGNAEAVFRNTGVMNLSAKRVEEFREDTQKEFDAIDAAMRIDQVRYGIDPSKQFNTYTYQKMEQTLQTNEQLLELGYQGHGTNHAIAEKYEGYTTDFQNNTDNKTYFVGGGSDNGEKAIAAFFDDVVLTHAPFPIVAQNGHLEQLNQNGDPEDTLDTVVAAANESAFTRVFVASDFSTDKNAVGEVRTVTYADPHAVDAPALPKAGAGQTTTLDGSVISDTITITAHVWKADATTGLFMTTADLKTEWTNALAKMMSGQKLTELERMEANAEAVLENTNARALKPEKLNQLRADTQREFDAEWAAMQINNIVGQRFNNHTYLMMEQTLQGNEALKELAIQGHGLNGNVPIKYRGFTEDFQNKTDNGTIYTGRGLDHGEKAIADFFDDVIISHASFPTVLHNGKLIQLNQNGNREDSLCGVVHAANHLMFTMDLTPDDFFNPNPKPAYKAPTPKKA